MAWTSGITIATGFTPASTDWNIFFGSGGNFDHLFDGTYIKTGLVKLADYEEGTLSPDTKPSGLSTGDAGRLFYASDFDRFYRWTGSAWEDAPGQEPRGTVRFFDTFSPGTGYQVCNGSSVTRSTSSGFTTALTVPNYSTAAYLKAKAASHTVGPTAAGGSLATTGAHTHTVNAHDHGPAGSLALGTPSSTTTVGAGVAGASTSTHTHTVTGRTANASPGTDSQGNHNHSPNTLELRRSELISAIRL